MNILLQGPFLKGDVAAIAHLLRQIEQRQPRARFSMVVEPHPDQMQTMAEALELLEETFPADPLGRPRQTVVKPRP